MTNPDLLKKQWRDLYENARAKYAFSLFLSALGFMFLGFSTITAGEANSNNFQKLNGNGDMSPFLAFTCLLLHSIFLIPIRCLFPEVSQYPSFRARLCCFFVHRWCYLLLVLSDILFSLLMRVLLVLVLFFYNYVTDT